MKYQPHEQELKSTDDRIKKVDEVFISSDDSKGVDDTEIPKFLESFNFSSPRSYKKYHVMNGSWYVALKE